MHVLAFVNEKGGCGKTTTAIHLAGALAARGERVLLVDLDPQAHATLGLGWAIEREPAAVDVLKDRVTVHEAALPASLGIRLLAGTRGLARFEESAEHAIGAEHVLARALERCRWSYDFVLIDCAPRTDGVLAANALRAADTAVLVVECGTFALQGALQAVEILEELAGTMEAPFALRAVGTLFDRRTELARELAIGMHAQLGPLLYDTFVRASDRLRACAAAGMPVHALDPACPAAEDFAALADEVVADARAKVEAERATERARDADTLASRSTPVLAARA